MSGSGQQFSETSHFDFVLLPAGSKTVPADDNTLCIAAGLFLAVDALVGEEREVRVEPTAKDAFGNSVEDGTAVDWFLKGLDG